MPSKSSPGAKRAFRMVAAASLALALGACASIESIGTLGLLPEEDDIAAPNFESYQAVETAYGNVVDGQTETSGLADLGFDASRAPNVEKLSYLGIMDRFMPGDSAKFDRLALPVQSCIEAQEHCSAMIFRPQRIHAQRTGSLILDVLGFDRTTVQSGWSAEVIFLMQDGRVVYKIMSGRPRIEEVHESVHPLGPLQDLGGTVLSVGSHVKI
jgi:hypothetical protein